MKTLGLKAHSKDLELALRVDPHVPRFVVGDVGRLRQVIVNLVGNSIKFTEKGEVVVEVTDLPCPPEEVLLEVKVRDTGIGIPEEKCKTIFNEFEQADSSTTRRFGGTGLGLAISSRLVKLMRGDIEVTSVVDEGSEFTFHVSLARAPSDFEEQHNRGVVVVGGTRVLVVDDNDTNRMILHEMLSNWGMIPTLAESGELALNEMQRANERHEPFGVIVSDVNMPEMSGYEFIEKIRGNLDSADTHVIILTSGGRDGDHSISEQLGIAERLMKPVKQSELFDAIVRCLGVSAPEDVASIDDDGPDLGHLKILLAEDNIINQKLAVGVLSKYGHDITIANNGQEAIDALQQQEFDVVLMDVQMPVMDGFATTMQIRQQEVETGGHMPIIAMTAHAMKGDRDKCIAVGMDEYVAKPIRINVLREKLAAVLGLASDPIQRGFAGSVAHGQDESQEFDFDYDPGDDSQATARTTENDARDDSDSIATPGSQSKTVADADASAADEDGAEATESGHHKVDPEIIDAIDWQHARTTVGGDGKLLCNLLNVYMTEAKKLLGQVEQAIEDQDQPTLKRAAHTLKGASLSVGAIRTSEVAQKLEDIQELPDFTFEQAARVFRDLNDKVDQVVALANEYLSGQA